MTTGEAITNHLTNFWIVKGRKVFLFDTQEAANTVAAELATIPNTVIEVAPNQIDDDAKVNGYFVNFEKP